MSEKLSARAWAQTPTGGFDVTHFRLPEGVKEFKVENVGPYQLSIIPYIVGQGNKMAAPGKMWYELTTFVHRGIGPNETMFSCPARTANLPCPICEYLRQKNGDPEYAKSIAIKERQLWNVFNHAKPGEGVQIWDYSAHLFGKQLKARVAGGAFAWYEWFADPQDGSKLHVQFLEKSFGGGNFYEASSIDFEQRGPLPPHILNAATRLEDISILLDYETLRGIFLSGLGGVAESYATTATAQGTTSAGGWGGPPATQQAAPGGGWGGPPAGAPAGAPPMTTAFGQPPQGPGGPPNQFGAPPAQQAPQGGPPAGWGGPPAAAAAVPWEAPPTAGAVDQWAAQQAAAAQQAPPVTAPPAAPPAEEPKAKKTRAAKGAAAATNAAEVPGKGAVIQYPPFGEVNVLKSGPEGLMIMDGSDQVHKNMPWPPAGAPPAAPPAQQAAPPAAPPATGQPPAGWGQQAPPPAQQAPQGGPPAGWGGPPAAGQPSPPPAPGAAWDANWQAPPAGATPGGWGQ